MNILNLQVNPCHDSSSYYKRSRIILFKGAVNGSRGLNVVCEPEHEDS